MQGTLNALGNKIAFEFRTNEKYHKILIAEDKSGLYYEPTRPEIFQIGKLLYRQGCQEVNLSAYLDWIYIPLLDITIKYKDVELFDCRVISLHGISLINKFLDSKCFPRYTIECCVILYELLNSTITTPEKLSKIIELTNTSADAKKIWVWFNTQFKELATRKLEALYYATIKAELAVATCQYNGFRIDTSVHQGFISMWKLQESNIKEILTRELPLVNFNSNKQVSETIENLMKNHQPEMLTEWKRTKTGLLQNTTETLAAFADNKEFGEIFSALILYKSVTKLISTYGKSLIEHIDKRSRIHSTFKLNGCVTGRITSSNPNIQNVPCNEIRRIFTTDPGNILIIGDFSQIELKVAAVLSKDQEMIECFNNNEDLHYKTAAILLKSDQITEDQRKLAKALNFGILYGQSAHGLVKSVYNSFAIRLSMSSAQDMINQFYKTYKGLRNWQQIQSKLIYSVTPLGRKKICKTFREKVNYPIQGAAAEIMLFTLENLPNRIKNTKSRVVNIIHDEIILETTTEYADRAKRVLEIIMNDAWKKFLMIVGANVKFKVANVKISDSWGHSTTQIDLQPHGFELKCKENPPVFMIT